ncbi:lysostaphin resistance A-like protein [Agrilactobacillus fermenti]|uniref:CPBP family intramembrane glutamic endopeptidase n=1 Tax=Agrilactobacillus fermenti TaxID=2586909 RepID=UPI003A5BF042
MALLLILELLGTLATYTFAPKLINQLHIPPLLVTSLYDSGCMITIWLANHFLTKQATFWTFDRQQVAGFFKSLTGKRIFLILLLIIYFLLSIMRHPNQLLEGLVDGGCTAIVEEFLFRGIVLGYLLRVIKPSKNQSIWLAIILSSLVFAFAHLGNAQVQPLLDTLFQVLQAFGVGLLLAALYLKTGSLISSMLLHFLIDFNSLAADAASESTAYNSSILVSTVVSIIVITIFFLLCRALLKDKHDLTLLNRPLDINN